MILVDEKLSNKQALNVALEFKHAARQQIAEACISSLVQSQRRMKLVISVCLMTQQEDQFMIEMTEQMGIEHCLPHPITPLNILTLLKSKKAST